MSAGYSFRPETINALFAQVMSSETKLNKEAVTLSSELLRLFTIEAINQSAIAARPAGFNTDSQRVVLQVSHLERILPQLLLDF
ncbi:hypothetical protein HDV05_005346 [Chytridiales sp. JEL 0842]|nr:hypothetical protein HDV05_005346 [Chytridiales sp. JEL 0842]